MQTEIVQIPLDMLARSDKNVRKHTATGIAELAASIERDTLLQNLTVEVAPPGHAHTHEVVAGGRRLAALQLLAKQGKIPGTMLVPCKVVSAAEGEAVSLAENQLREAMHPIDQMQAFVDRVMAGDPVADVAARFGVTETFVRQRIKLANVSPALLEAYRAGQMTLECLQAFTITDDQARQLEVWNELNDDDFGSFDADDIRGALLRETVDAKDYRLKFVGLKAYQKAGGAIIKADLFAEDAREVVSDPALLDDLVGEKLQKKAAKLQKDEGLAFVEVRVGSGFSEWREADFCRATVQQLQPNDEQGALLKELEDKIEALGKQQEEAADAENMEEYDRLEGEIDELQAKVDAIGEALKAPHPDEVEHIGAFLCLYSDGKAEVERNIIRKEHRAKAKAAPAGERTSAAGDGDDADQEQLAAQKSAHGEKLIRRLTAHKTAILRDMMMPHVGDGSIALGVTVFHMLVEDLRGDEMVGWVQPPLTMTTRTLNRLEAAADDIESSPAVARSLRLENELLDPIRAALAEVAEDGKEAALLAYLSPLPVAHLLKLLSLCVSKRLDVVAGAEGQRGTSGVVAEMLLTDKIVARGWEPTRAGYLDHVSKPQIIAAVTEACGAETAATLAPMKKAEAAERAEQLLAGTGWLPSPLRMAKP